MTTTHEPLPRVLPFRHLLLLLAGCVGLSWLMVPKQGELIDRLIKDHRYERVVAVLQNSVAHPGSANLNGLRELSTAQLADLSDLLKLTPREQLKTVFESRRNLPYDNYVHNIVLAAIQFVDVMPPTEAYHSIVPRIERVPKALRSDLLMVIARNAQAVGKADLAAQALQQACELEGATWVTVEDMVRSFRWSGQPGTAGKELVRWLAVNQGGLTVSQRDEALGLQFDLALESGRPGDAFEHCLTALKWVSGNPETQRLWMERALDTALQSSRTKDLIPMTEKYLTSFPEEHLKIEQLRADYAREPGRFENFRRWELNLAHWADWNSEFDRAFEAHERLAAMGSLESLDRCLDLNEAAGRAADTAALIEALGEIPERPKLRLELAHMLGELGEDKRAQAAFEAWLQKHPNDRGAHYDYYALLESMGDLAGARHALENLLHLHPGDAPAMKKLAEACIRDGDYEAALKLYADLPEKAHDHDTLENYASIAESLDNHQEQFRALHLTAQQQSKPSVETYLELAETSAYLSDQQPAIDALNEGLTRLPKSATLRVALANTYLEAERPDDAVATLLVPELKQNIEAAHLLLSLSEELSEPTKVLAFLGDDADKRLALSPRLRLQLAVLNHHASRGAEAARLFASVRESSSTFKLLAEARFQTGDYSQAVRLQKEHLQAHSHASSADWAFLGDILQQMELPDEAKKAYDASLAVITGDLPGTAAN